MISRSLSDINYDGYNEVIIGGYSQQLIIYKEVRETQQSYHTSNSHNEEQKTMMISEMRTTPINTIEHKSNQKFEVISKHHLSQPICDIVVDDFCNDGTQSVIVTSIYGIYLFQVFDFLSFSTLKHTNNSQFNSSQHFELF
jgi:hypothetical protein